MTAFSPYAGSVVARDGRPCSDNSAPGARVQPTGAQPPGSAHATFTPGVDSALSTLASAIIKNHYVLVPSSRKTANVEQSTLIIVSAAVLPGFCRSAGISMGKTIRDAIAGTATPIIAGGGRRGPAPVPSTFTYFANELRF